MLWTAWERGCMKEERRKYLQAQRQCVPTLIKTMFLASVTPPSSPHSPQHLLTAAIYSHTPKLGLTIATCNPPLFKNPTLSSHHMLLRASPGGRDAERKAACMPCILARPRLSPSTQRNLRGRQTGALYASLHLWGGGHGRLRGCKRL